MQGDSFSLTKDSINAINTDESLSTMIQSYHENNKGFMAIMLREASYFF